MLQINLCRNSGFVRPGLAQSVECPNCLRKVGSSNPGGGQILLASASPVYMLGLPTSMRRCCLIPDRNY